MSNLEAIISNGLEGKRIEFKEKFPTDNKIAKTAIAFSNGVGGKIIVGVNDLSKEIVGIADKEIFKLEEKISQSIFDNCYPTISPEITIHSINNKNLLVVTIYPGNDLPYFLKSKGKQNGTYIRVGSSNRVATIEIINQLERQKRNISFDSLPIFGFNEDLPPLNRFVKFYKDKAKRDLSQGDFKSMELLKEEPGELYPTNAMLLLAEKEVRKAYFPYAQIECARFKGTTTSEIIDQISCESPIILQAEEAIKFIKRNIAKQSTIGEIYRSDKWEYPIEAIREAVINAVIHRDYSITGSDIKIAIYDDMLEITSPGSLVPSFDLNNISNNPSEIRNKVLAPIFKECNLIEKWGSGFKKILEQMDKYPELELRITEPSNTTQIQFVKKSFLEESRTFPKNDLADETDNMADIMTDKTNDLADKILFVIAQDNYITIQSIADKVASSKRTIERYIKKMQESNTLTRIGPKKGGYWKIN